MDKFVVLVEFFFCDFRAFNFSRTMNRVNYHCLFFRSSRKVFVTVCYSFFHNLLTLLSLYNYRIIPRKFDSIKVKSLVKIAKEEL